MLLEVSDVSKDYGKIKAVKNVSFRINIGEIFGLLGPNGAGKTSILEMIEGIRRLNSGSVLFNGKLLNKKELSFFLGIQFQENSLFDLMTVEETIGYFATIYNLKDKKQDSLLEYMALDQMKHKKAGELSIGQQRSLCVLLAFIHKPALVILDEPTSGLDPIARRRLWGFLNEYIRDKNNAILLSTHYMDEAEYLCHRVALLNRGEIVGLGSPEELIRNIGLQGIISFTCSNLENYDFAGSIQNVVSVHRRSNSVILKTSELFTTLNSLLDEVRKLKIELTDLQVRKLNLEDVFLKLAGQEFMDEDNQTILV